MFKLFKLYLLNQKTYKMLEQPTQESMKQPSPEEIKEMQTKMTNFYEENTPFLEKQCKYEELKTRIEVARYSFMEAIAKQANLRAQMNQKGPEKNPVQEPTKTQ